MDLHVFPIPIPAPASLPKNFWIKDSLRDLWEPLHLFPIFFQKERGGSFLWKALTDCVEWKTPEAQKYRL